jgi:hypothetical protein
MTHLSEDDIDIARLDVLLAFQKLNADTEGLSVVQTDSGITVAGIVENDNRKMQITDRLRMIPHVTVNVHSYRDFDSKPGIESGVTSIKAMSLVAGESPLDNQCAAQRVLRDRCQQLAFLLLNVSATLVRENNRLGDLQRQYPPTRSLTPSARAVLNELIRLHVDHLAIAAEEEEQVFPTLGLEHPHKLNGDAIHLADMRDIVQQNLLLAKELVYAGDEHSRSAPLIIRDLAVSAEEVRTAVSHIPVPAANRTAFSSSTSTPHHD